jgi:hypothetical protein
LKGEGHNEPVPSEPVPSPSNKEQVNPDTAALASSPKEGEAMPVDEEMPLDESDSAPAHNPSGNPSGNTSPVLGKLHWIIFRETTI